ncbi:MAG: mechanosensitive ion channel family protein [Treponema sp.]|nr:mechanosensitive ion channel family protein [Treponema sp.]
MEETISSTMVEAAANAGASLVKQTSSFVAWAKTFITWENVFKLAGTILILLAFWLAYKLAIRGIKKIPVQKLSKQKSSLILRFLKYAFYVLITMYVLSLFGIKFSAIWGAAGIAGVAIGFAAQTSVSNLISGLFVITEGSVKIGDLIVVDGITGIVDSVNLISVQVHTLDNEMVRIPNSTIINANLTNKTFHHKRRLTIQVSVAYDTDMKLALETLSKAPALCPTVLTDPAPAFWYDGFDASGINMTAAVWFNNDDFLQTKNDMFIAIKKVFDEAGIEIPFNQLDVMIKK